MSTGSDIAKAGWLYRQSSVLHRWKRNWFVLYTDGLLRYFESQDSSRAEEVFILRAVCQRIKTGPEVKPTNPPDEIRSGKSCMFELDMRDGNHLLLCAETDDDMKAWQYSLEEARAMAPPGGPMIAGPSAMPMGYTSYQRVPYGGYPGQVISTMPPQVVQTPQGTTTIINQAPPMLVMNDPYDYRHRYGGFGYGGFGHRRYGRPGNMYVATTRYW